MIIFQLKIKTLLLPVLYLVTGFCISQESNFKKVESLLNQFELDSAEIILEKTKIIKDSIFENALYSYYNGIILKRKDRHDLGFKELIKALKLFKQIDSLMHWANTNYEIIDLLLQQNNLDVEIKPYLDKYYTYAKKIDDPLMLARAYSKYASLSLRVDDFGSTISYYKKTINKLKIIKDTLRVAIIETNIGSLYYGTKRNADSALYYYKKSLPIFKKYNIQQYISNNYNNQAKAYELIGNYSKALDLFELAKSIPLSEYNIKTQEVYYNNQLKVHKKNKDYKNAFLSAEKLITIRDSINNTRQNIAISEINEKYNNEKLRADNAESETKRLESEIKRKRNRNIAFGLGGSLILGSIIAFLLFKNTKRKQRIAEQENELQSQKLATVLKEQELTAIDAMIEGQEKERQRIANDLHDDLGGLMTNVKWHFDALKDKQSSELFDKTNTLLDEAYQKIRGIAHAKNSGVIAKQGLLKAVKQMAEKVSALNKIQIHVIDHGLENRLENSLELTIFRIIQELTTNIIKHAQATEAMIHITNHEESLNILVEDNGKGFNPSQITKTNKGMGISSIDKRVEHLEGTMTIESEPKKGTTIIIDIPL